VKKRKQICHGKGAFDNHFTPNVLEINKKS
jgi:hypothetical protein